MAKSETEVTVDIGASARNTDALVARAEARLEKVLRALDFIESKTWYERHVTGIVGALALAFGFVLGHIR